MKKIQSYDRKFVVKHYMKSLKFRMTSTREKNLWLPTQEWNDNSRWVGYL